MEEILKQEKSSSHKEFEKLLSEDLSNRVLKEGEIITGTVSSIGKKHIFVDRFVLIFLSLSLYIYMYIFS